MHQIIPVIQVNIPFTMLYESYLSLFMENGINPEIGFDAIALDQFSFSDFRGIAKQIHKRGLSVTLHAPFMDLSPGSPDPAVRALTRHRFKQISELVPIFRPRAVVCHTGWDNKRYWDSKDTWIQYSLELWSWFAEIVRKDRAVLMLENVYEENPYEFLELYRHLKDQDVGFCLDTGHQAVFSRAGLSIWLETLGEYIEQLHLHDNNGFQDDHLALGKGNIDFQILFNYLKNRRTKPPIITIEPHKEEDFWHSLEYIKDTWLWQTRVDSFYD